jgi:hypothetical protein
VGFFADAGEKARLYWMRVSKNEDFIGRICAYITGNTTTAELWPQNPYGGPHSRTGDDAQPVEALGAAALGVVGKKRNRKSGLKNWNIRATAAPEAGEPALDGRADPQSEIGDKE